MISVNISSVIVLLKRRPTQSHPNHVSGWRRSSQCCINQTGMKEGSYQGILRSKLLGYCVYVNFSLDLQWFPMKFQGISLWIPQGRPMVAPRFSASSRKFYMGWTLKSCDLKFEGSLQNRSFPGMYMNYVLFSVT